MNVVVLFGRVSRPAEERVLPSGDRLLQLDVTVERPGDRAESVPIVCIDPPAAVAGLDVETEVVVLGRVRRRFFRSGGVTQSRTEVVAEQIVPRRHSRKVAAAVERARQRLDDADVEA